MKIPKRLLRWWERLLSWAETLGRFWASYWLLLIGCALVCGSVALKWVQFPFSHNVSAIKLSLFQDPGVDPHISLFSIGVLGVGALALGVILVKKLPYVLSLSAAFLLMLWAITPAQIAFRQPSMLRRLTYELEVTPLLHVFSKDYLLQNYGAPELVPKHLILYSAWGRFMAAQSFLRFGWYCFGIGALFVGAHAIAQMRGGRPTRLFMLLCLPAGALLIVLIPAAIGQHYYTEGTLAATAGRNQEAIDNYRKAMRWDSWHSHDIDLYATIGELQKHGGLSVNSPERHVQRAVELREDNQFEPAIFELGQAAEAGGALGETARREIVATRMSLGLALYHAGGASGAVTNWEMALAEDPTLIYVMPYLIRGYYDVGRYQSGIDMGERLMKLIKDHNFTVANVYSMTADCYAKLGNDEQARKYYNLSLVADPIMNYWALTGLAGE